MRPAALDFEVRAQRLGELLQAVEMIAERLPATLEQLLGYLEGAEFSSEVIVVDYGSSDDTAQKVASPATVIRNDSNHGKGSAVKQGIQAASGAVRVFMDADLSVPPEYLLELVHRIRDGHDVVIGSRVVSGAEVVAGGREYRRTMGRVFNGFVQLLATCYADQTQQAGTKQPDSCRYRNRTREGEADIPGLEVLGTEEAAPCTTDGATLHENRCRAVPGSAVDGASCVGCSSSHQKTNMNAREWFCCKTAIFISVS